MIFEVKESSYPLYVTHVLSTPGCSDIMPTLGLKNVNRTNFELFRIPVIPVLGCPWSKLRWGAHEWFSKCWSLFGSVIECGTWYLGDPKGDRNFDSHPHGLVRKQARLHAGSVILPALHDLVGALAYGLA